MSDPFDLLREHIDGRFEDVHRRIDDRHQDVMERVVTIQRILEGNGQPGLVRLVDRHEQRIRSSDIATRKQAVIWGSLVSGIIAAVAAMLGRIYGASP